MEYIILLLCLCVPPTFPLSLLSPEDVLSPPVTQHTVYVDGVHGDDQHDGHSQSTAFRTLKHAMKSSSPKTKIYVMSGEYTNLGYGEGLDNGAVMTIKELEYLLVLDCKTVSAGHSRHPPHQLA